MIVVVVCGGACSDGCRCGGGCWFLGGGDCHWAVHLCIGWVLSKYIILMFRIKWCDKWQIVKWCVKIIK